MMLLDIQDLDLAFGEGDDAVRILTGVSLVVDRGELVGLVGESGSGKSTVAKMVLKLEDPTSGTIEIDGMDVSGFSRAQSFGLRRRMQPVFQDPYGSLDPLRNLENTIAEPPEIHGVGDRTSR
ncbi:ATP-binding cassette domain-containing protein, partial [Enterococcus faecium]|uniref:ATP-binding cassette domain-containing protein n=1 Tax=Enterococcus faecium TaxID=1352 RepID=UPI0030C8AC77